MKVNFTELDCIVEPVPEKEVHENLLANVKIKLTEEDGDCITVTSFTLWRSKYNNNYRLEAPNKENGKFYYFSASEPLEERIEQDAIEEYERKKNNKSSPKNVDYEEIPVIEEEN